VKTLSTLIARSSRRAALGLGLAAALSCAAMLPALAAVQVPVLADRDFSIVRTTDHNTTAVLHVDHDIQGTGPWSFTGKITPTGGVGTPVKGTMTQVSTSGFQIAFTNTVNAASWVKYEGAVVADYVSTTAPTFMAGFSKSYFQKAPGYPISVSGPRPFCASGFTVTEPPK
jgi:hypothetical protein